jgi:transposase
MNSELPDDIEQLKALLRKQQSQLRQSASQNPHAVNPHGNRCRQNFPGRRIAFCLLPTENSCPACGGALKEMGETISAQLDIINSAFMVIETIRPKLACNRCDVIVQVPLPPKPIERGYASAGLLARILVCKYVEHTPLYRQSEIYARQGVELSHNTMVRWVSEMADKLRPLYIALNDYVLKAGKVHTDDTPVKVLAPGSGMNRPGFPGECFICELRLPDHRFRWKHNKLFLLLPEEYGPAFPAIVDCYTTPPT